MNKKNILFVMPNLKVGGIQSAFKNLIYELSKEDLNIDVLCFDADDVGTLPDNVGVLKSGRLLRMLTVNQKTISKESSLLGAFRYMCGAYIKAFGQKYLYKILFKFCKKYSGYDAAISFAQSPNRSLYGGFNEFVLYNVDAKQKITFMHCDYNQSGINTAYSKKIYSRFDKIAAVSNAVGEIFKSACPELSDKVEVVHNCHQFDKIKKQALIDTVEYKKDVLNFVTVARISHEKGHMRMLEVLRRLKQEGKAFCWHVVGGGEESLLLDINKKINDYNLGDYVKLYGNQDNPYKFIKNADFMVVPSLHEAAPMVYHESFALGVPVISTNTAPAKEFVAKNGYGLVCDNSEEGLYNAINGVCANPLLLDSCKTKLQQTDFTNKNATAEFMKIAGLWGENN